MLARKALLDSGQLNDVSQLADKVIALDAISVEGYFLETLLNTGGLTLDGFPGKFTEFDDPGTEIDAFQKGTLDLSVQSEPWLTRSNKIGVTKTWKTFNEVLPNFQYSMNFFGANLLKNREVGQRFMNAYLKAVKFYNQGKTEKNIQYMVDFTGMEKDIVTEMCWAQLREDGSINTQSLVDYQNWALKRGYIESVLSPEQFWDAEYIQNASK